MKTLHTINTERGEMVLCGSLPFNSINSVDLEGASEPIHWGAAQWALESTSDVE